jgi:hypothetical protein
MADYHAFTATRVPPISLAALNVALRAADPTAGVVTIVGAVVTVKSNTAWSPARIAAAQTILDTAPELTPQTRAQLQVDQLPIEFKALVLALIDELNIIRAALPTPLAARTPAQAIAAIRAKAATL